MKLTLQQKYMLSVLHGQYHACWCSGDLKSQCISKHGITLKARSFSLQHQKSLFTVESIIAFSFEGQPCGFDISINLSFSIDNDITSGNSSTDYEDYDEDDSTIVYENQAFQDAKARSRSVTDVTSVSTACFDFISKMQFRKCWWAHNSNLHMIWYICCCYMKNVEEIRPQFCTCHDSWAVVTCANLWPD